MLPGADPNGGVALGVAGGQILALPPEEPPVQPENYLEYCCYSTLL